MEFLEEATEEGDIISENYSLGEEEELLSKEEMEITLGPKTRTALQLVRDKLQKLESKIATFSNKGTLLQEQITVLQTDLESNIDEYDKRGKIRVEYDKRGTILRSSSLRFITEE